MNIKDEYTLRSFLCSNCKIFPREKEYKNPCTGHAKGECAQVNLDRILKENLLLSAEHKTIMTLKFCTDTPVNHHPGVPSILEANKDVEDYRRRNHA